MENKNFQAILPLGYLYIVILGVLKEAFYYSQLGVDYFNYSTVADILISPISELTTNIYTILGFIIFVLITFLLPIQLVKSKDKPWFEKSFKIDGNQELDVIQRQLLQFFLMLFCLGLMGFYIGMGIGQGFKISKQIKNGTIEFEDKIEMVDGKTETVNLIGKNSSFLFYLSEGKKEIEITPINGGVIKSIMEKR